MNDQQWVLQRKKIGLSRRSKKALQAKMVEEKQKMSAISYIHTHFNRKECTKYVPAHNNVCACGLLFKEHKTKGELETENDLMFGTKYVHDLDKVSEVSESTSIHESETADSLADLLTSPSINHTKKALKNAKALTTSIVKMGEQEVKRNDMIIKDSKSIPISQHIHEFSTNAYGQIEFEGIQASKLTKYLRLADNSTMSSVKEFICDYWNLMKPRPHLVLSIVGGAKNFKLDGRKKETFKRGLIAAAQATNAWILSGGTHAGCMKLIGETVREGQFLVSDGTKMRRGLKALGLCPWGYIANREHLVNDRSNEFKRVIYNSNVEIKRHVKPPLDPNHTHFLMIDNGTNQQYFKAESGGITEFITQFERMVSDPEPKGLGIPIITLLLEGGTDAIYKVKPF